MVVISFSKRFAASCTAASSLAFDTAPGLGLPTSSITTVNWSASQSPSVRYTKGVAQFPESPPFAPGAFVRSRYMAHSHAKLFRVRLRCVSSRNGTEVAFKSTCFTIKCLVPVSSGVWRGTDVPRTSFVTTAPSCVVTGITTVLACTIHRSACTMRVSNRIPLRVTASLASCSNAVFLVSVASIATIEVGANTTASRGVSNPRGSR
mmetsp:Transcript_12472/g.46590  ORF Transcript_12472/g.46590 Transcript_12472/m.46590 type:complete len:206 (-) Transcript_12472:228-845(-)